MTRYKVGYVANDGASACFSFESDHKMIVSARNRSNTGVDLGYPWLEDAKQAEKRWMEKPDSWMNYHGGVKAWRYVANADTGKFVSLA